MSVQTTQARKWLGRRQIWLPLVIGLALLVISAPLLGAEIGEGEGDQDTYRLPAGEVIQDDLYVAAGEIFIDGIIEGDLVAAGGYIEVNGEVTGDLIAIGGGIVVNGRIGDDVRVAGGGVTIAGPIGDDLFAVGGGPGWPGMPSFPMSINGRPVAQGLRLASSATVAGDAYLAGGQGVIDGQIGGALFAGMGSLRFGGQVNEDANLYASTLVVEERARVGGELRYSSNQPTVIPAGVAATTVQVEPDRPAPEPPNPAWPLLRWLWRTALLVIGFALAAWLIWQLAPGLVRSAGSRIGVRPLEAGLYGLVAAALILPVVIAVVVIGAIFWGVWGALATLMFLLGAVALLWLLSPLVTGYWLGHLVADRGYRLSDLVALLLGTLLIVVVARLFALIPFIGVLFAGLIYLISFVLTLGGMILTRRRATLPAPPPATSTVS